MIATIENEVSFCKRNADILSDKVLKDFMTSRNKKSLKDLKGKIAFRDDDADTDKKEHEQLKTAFFNGSKRSMAQQLDKYLS